MNAKTYSSGPASYELRFQSLHDAGRAFVFPCDAAGHVDMDALTDTAREDYLFARIVVGHDICAPAVVVDSHH
jgi:hypothetical protein